MRLVALVSVLSIGFELASAPQAEAGPGCPSGPVLTHGRSAYCGYFDDNHDTDGVEVFVGGVPAFVDTPQEFIDLMFDRKRPTQTANYRTGAQFIILTMLGYPAGTPRAMADTVFPEFAARVHAAGPQTIWHFNYQFTCGTLNSFYQNSTNDDAFYRESKNCGPGVFRDSIIFRDPAGNWLYVLKRDCANPIGVVNPLPAASYELHTSLTPGAIPTPAFGGVVQPGQTYYLTPSVFNSGPGPAPLFGLEIGNLSPGNIINAGISSPGGHSTVAVYIPTCMAAPECWHWRFGSGLPPGTGSTHTNGAAFTVVGADNTPVCFNLTTWPHSTADPGLHITGPYCFTIQNPHYPAIIGRSGDVHAGGTTCGAPTAPSAGSIFTSTSSQSLSEYVVSSNGPVTNFGSNNAAGGSAATLGKNGNYYSICRPDLVARAQAAGGPDLPAGFTGNVATLPGGLYFHRGGGDLTLRGTFNHKITIVSLTGRVIIDGDIRLNAPNVVGSLAPSMGIISAGDILITGGTAGVNRQVDAYLFSNGTINTCSDAVLGTEPACRNSLIVNGFLMGQGLSFRRFGPAVATTTSTLGEQVNLAGQIYLNPPKFFDNASTANLLRNQGEKPPLN